ncbi:hypothetical protein Plhal703r1_c19g0087481 [Plasmopara halstedii]
MTTKRQSSNSPSPNYPHRLQRMPELHRARTMLATRFKDVVTAETLDNHSEVLYLHFLSPATLPVRRA